jgi:hypothetical protein
MGKSVGQEKQSMAGIQALPLIKTYLLTLKG